MSFEIIRRNEILRNREKHLIKTGSGGKFSVCLVYPNTYSAGMSNLGFQAIYRQIAESPDFYCDRSFLPDPDIVPLYKKSKRTLVGLESEKPLQEFDFVAFSISYELDYLNIPGILEYAGIPLSAEDRGEKWPLVFAGGAAVSINPEIISKFVDFFVIGEGEEPLSRIMKILSEENWKNRKDLLEILSEIPGVYVPSLYKISYDEHGFIEEVIHSPHISYPVERSISCNLVNFTDSVILSPDTEFADTYLVEISRGCPFACSFCCVSLHHKPYRCASLEDIIAKISKGLSFTGKIGLLGAAVGSYPHLETLLDVIKKNNGEVSFSSLRADELKPGLLRKLNELGQNLLTLAPETGSEELRRSLNKTLKNDRIYQTADEAIASGFKDIRLYFMTGLPGETDEDIEAGIVMIREISGMTRRVGGRVLISVNQFVPKPGTDMELCRFEEEGVVIPRIKRMESTFFNNPAVVFRVESIKEMQVQAFLGRANRKWSDYLLNLFHKSPSNIASRLMKLRKKDPSVDSIIFQPITPGQIPPWRILSGRK
jgi:radical SAM superfamily enzyme YgiQ (UPF0313 family)